ncbi:uncharacterized protein N7459_002136 [Penicillium hispanicum]|uniref:uncharacterized protein n=1 Tax=Penicillium hispanicum TaxID=1080232 RepID=UPI00253FC44B|nr:uncharacterized protein N7459_002136 [Penicillium hispanicum]KAJ5591767.1 hypothetical protein N7459_002136 [Penicillium hispanicum]
MAAISDLISASTAIQNSTGLSKESFDCQIREHIAFIRQSLSTKALSSLLSDETALDPLLAARLIRDAMLRLDPSCAVFTSTHLLLVQLCLHARAYACALPVLERHICHIPGPDSIDPSTPSTVLCEEDNTSLTFMANGTGFSSRLSYRDYLRYFLYSGMVYMALKEWRKALNFLGTVISIPTTSSMSLVMVEAYKKWILVGLLDKGKLCSPPNMTASHMTKMYHSLARPYVNLGHAFESGDILRLQAEVGAGQDIWCADNNMSLVTQVVKAFSAHTLIGTKKIFAALTVAEISEQAPSLPLDGEQAESTIASLIMSGAMDATLVHPPRQAGETMLRFPANPSFAQLSREFDLRAYLDKEAYSLGRLMGNLTQSSHRLGLSDEFVDGLQKGQQWAGDGNTGLAMVGNMGVEMEEDIMGDLS